MKKQSADKAALLKYWAEESHKYNYMLDCSKNMLNLFMRNLLFQTNNNCIIQPFESNVIEKTAFYNL